MTISGLQLGRPSFNRSEALAGQTQMSLIFCLKSKMFLKIANSGLQLAGLDLIVLVL